MPNQFGLSRNIPETVKLQVRQHCGFGCAICGVTITEYEHFYPNFSEAKVHNCDSIVLLCPTHHALATKGILPKEQVLAAHRAPAAKAAGFSSFNHPWFRGVPSLKMGGGPLLVQTPIPIQVQQVNLIQFDPPLDDHNVCRISANLQDAYGDNYLKVEENEWKIIAGNWDFQCVGNRYIFKDRFGTPMLVLRMEPPDFIAIELLKTSVNGTPIHITEQDILIGTNRMTGGIFSGCKIGLSIS